MSQAIFKNEENPSEFYICTTELHEVVVDVYGHLNGDDYSVSFVTIVNSTIDITGLVDTQALTRWVNENQESVAEKKYLTKNYGV